MAIIPYTAPIREAQKRGIGGFLLDLAEAGAPIYETVASVEAAEDLRRSNMLTQQRAHELAKFRAETERLAALAIGAPDGGTGTPTRNRPSPSMQSPGEIWQSMPPAARYTVGGLALFLAGLITWKAVTD